MNDHTVTPMNNAQSKVVRPGTKYKYQAPVIYKDPNILKVTEPFNPYFEESSDFIASIEGNLWGNVHLNFCDTHDSQMLVFDHHETDPLNSYKNYRIAEAKFESTEDLLEVFNYLKSLRVTYYDEKQYQGLLLAWSRTCSTPMPATDGNALMESFWHWCDKNNFRRIGQEEPNYPNSIN